MNFRTLIALWKANVPHWILTSLLICTGAILLGLGGGTPDWVHLGVFLPTTILGLAIAEYAGTLADRHEDWLYGPTNPIVTGELDAGTAKKAFIVQNIVAGSLGFALMLITLDYALTLAMIACWAIALAYSVPPFRIKETGAGPAFLALGVALIPIAGWLLVAPLTKFIALFAAFWFLYTCGFGYTLKFRKTYLALNADLIQLEEGGSIYDLATVGKGPRVKNAMALEVLAITAAFVLVSVCWALDIFDMPLSVGLLALCLPPTLAGIVLRIKAPFDNSVKATQYIALGWTIVHPIFFAFALNRGLDWNWGYAVLAGIASLGGFLLLMRIVHPTGSKSMQDY